VIQQAAAATWFATVPHPAKPKGWDITWGAQIDPKVVRLTGNWEITDTKVAETRTVARQVKANAAPCCCTKIKEVDSMIGTGL
jgi:hypothetical protein